MDNSPKPLDRLDRKILRELQVNGRLSNVELASRVGLSATPCLERVRRLERNGYITGYCALVDPRKVEAGLLVFVEIRLKATSPEGFNEFKASIAKIPEILECHLIAGDFEYLLKARVPDMDAYRLLLGETLLILPHVRESRTYVAMEEVKNTTVVNIR
ncbi:AsnC family transcriptional regulator [Marinomonas sp. 42_23_T18]|nr:AsnC family transcriptional regulator [Marinomonas sp. 42_23_T18]